MPLFMNKHFNKIFYKLPLRLFGVGSSLKYARMTKLRRFKISLKNSESKLINNK